MNESTHGSSGPVIALNLVLLAFGLAALAWWDSVKCDARWPDRDVEWSLPSGCMVKGVNGVFLPEDRIWFEKGE